MTIYAALIVEVFENGCTRLYILYVRRNIMKKNIAIVCIFLMMLGITGCAKTIELTDEEQYLVAEYAVCSRQSRRA